MDRERFIRATEIWVPSADGSTIDLQSGLYGELDYFAAVSRGMRFDYGEGLPGKVWETGKPMILRDLANSYFVRKEAAMTEGLSCAVALPTFVEGALASVTILFCGDDRFRKGALELWGLCEGQRELSLIDGYFGNAAAFEQEARTMGFARGSGVPGRVWASGRPVILTSLAADEGFMRSDAADVLGLDRAVGLPCQSLDGEPFVLALVSANGSPVAGRLEHWERQPDGSGFRFRAGYCETADALHEIHKDVLIPEDIGPFGRACRRGVALVDEDLATDVENVTAVSAVAAGMKSMVVFPLQGPEQFDAVVAWYF